VHSPKGGTSAIILALLAAISLPAATIEKRGAADWPTHNHFRFAAPLTAQVGTPVLVTQTLPANFNPDSLRVIAANSRDTVPSKVEWHAPNVEVSWLSAGPATYHVYFDLAAEGETARLAAPAMVGTGDRVTYGQAGVRGRLSVGLWAHPVALDFDNDGNRRSRVAGRGSTGRGR